MYRRSSTAITAWMSFGSKCGPCPEDAAPGGAWKSFSSRVSTTMSSLSGLEEVHGKQESGQAEPVAERAARKGQGGAGEVLQGQLELDRNCRAGKMDDRYFAGFTQAVHAQPGQNGVMRRPGGNRCARSGPCGWLDAQITRSFAHNFVRRVFLPAGRWPTGYPGWF